MSAIRFDCRGIADRFLHWVKNEVDHMPRRPTIATLFYSPSRNDSSVRYQNLIFKDAERLGITAMSMSAGDEQEMVRHLRAMNADERVTGIVVLYPLGASIPDEDVMDLVSEAKDVEGLHSINLGYLLKYKIFLDQAHGVKCVVPATAKAVVKTLQAYPEIHIEGALVTIVNNSMRVGKPLGLMLENLGATVIKCYDRTPAEVLESSIRQADILVTAVPSKEFKIKADFIKQGAAVFDLSYDGNMDIDAVAERAAFITSTDNRIGQVTRAMILVNLVYCAQRQLRL